MSAALRKGWCPGALRPMMARDGLLVRLRLTGGRLDADRARALAALAAFYGNGLLDLSARGNLQLRGVAPAHWTSLLAALADLGMLDEDADGEAVRNVMASPLAGMPGRYDVAPIVEALEARLTGDRALHALPGKFGFLVDDGGAAGLAAEAADVRFDFAHGEPRAWIGLGGTRDSAVSLGTCAADEVAATAAAIARTFLALAAGCEPPVRRMKDLVARLGAYQTARAFGAAADETRPGYAGAIFSRAPVGSFSADGVAVLGLAVPFGRLNNAMLRAAADLADTIGRGALRLTPWRCILVPGLTAPVDIDACRTAGFLVDADHPLRRVAACVGEDGCAQGTTPTQADAAVLADLAARLPGAAATVLHVSGCAKGCAKASRTAFTLVGREGRYDLVHNGTAGDAPSRRDLDLPAAHAAIMAAGRMSA